MPLLYNNEQLSNILNDKQLTLDMAKAFLNIMKKELVENQDSRFVNIYLEAAEAHFTRLLNIIWACAESPIERIFMSSLYMNFIRNHEPLGLVITAPMANTVQNMEELRLSINDMKAAIRSRQLTGDDISFPALLRDLDCAVETKEISPVQYDLNLHLLWCYHFWGLADALHLTPQASFPNTLSSKRGVRADLLFWVPNKRDFKVIVECDSYQYHENNKSFDYDRQRSRALQLLGFKVLQYSGGEIFRDPIRASYELYDYLSDEIEKPEANKMDAEPISSSLKED